MFNLYTKQKQDREAAAAAATPELEMTTERRDRLCRSVHGRSKVQLAHAHEERVRESIAQTVEHGIPEPDVGDHPSKHSFRSRQVAKELSHPYVSATRLVPRTCFMGGGELRPDAVAKLPPHGIKPHLVHSSNSCESIARVVQMPYVGSMRNILARGRAKEHELGLPMRFTTDVTESARINATIAKNKALSLSSSGPWEGSIMGTPTWRAGGKDEFVGRKVFQLTSKPADNYRDTIRGRPVEASMLIQIPFAARSNPCERQRVPERECGDTLVATFPSSGSLDVMMNDLRMMKPRHVTVLDPAEGGGGGGPSRSGSQTRLFLDNTSTRPLRGATLTGRRHGAGTKGGRGPKSGKSLPLLPRSASEPGRPSGGKYYATSLRQALSQARMVDGGGESPWA